MRLICTGKKNHKRFLYLLIWLNLLGTCVYAQNPIASFSSNVSSGCVPLSVFFINSSTQANSYYWNFGNGSTSTLANPSVVYSLPGNFVVSLVAINTINNLRDSVTQVITVVPDPVANFTAAPLTSCAGSTAVIFNNTSTFGNNFTWDYGDGNSSTATSPTHVYNTPGNYTVKLIASNTYGCSDIHIATNYVHIRPTPVAAFTTNLTSTCNVNTVFNFSCTTPGATTHTWNFGDGSTSTLLNPSHVYSAPGSYTITLIVSDNFGCSDTLVSPNYINIGPSLVPAFTVNSTTGCVPFNCVFTCNVPGATSWFWDFGDGSTSTLQNPSHLYGTDGNYSITLTITTSSGCNGTTTLNNYIDVDALPTATFGTVQDSGCIPFNAQFVNSSGGAVSWLWDFGDGTNDTLQNPSHTYNAIGNYTVTLHAYSANGCESVIVDSNAVVCKKATASFNASNNIGCPPLNVTFNSNGSNGNIVSWFWVFGDGSTSTLPNPSHTYNTIGNYTVKLFVTNMLGCTDSLIRFNYVKVVSGVTNYTVPDTLKLCQPGVINCVDPTLGSNTWAWNFGDGTTSNIKNPSHTYPNPGIYTITLSNNMPGGCAQTFNPYAIVQVMPVSLAPIVPISVSTCPPYIVSLANSTPNVASFLWNFGDGTTSTLQNPSHTYANSGTYVITLTLVMQSGCTTSMSKTIIVGHANPITANGTQFCLGDVAQFSINNPQAFVSYNWNFGDGTSSSQTNPSHTYTAVGGYLVSVTTTDTAGCVSTYNYTSFITVTNPIAAFTVTGPTTGCSNLMVTFNNTSTNAASYFWDFGDGSTSTATNPTHLYATPGVYTVTLTATNNGCTRTSVHNNQIIINAAQCNFMFSYNSGCLPITATYTDLSPNAVSWLWHFGDGTTSTLKNPVHIFTTAPVNNVTLTIVDVFGCTKTKSKSNVNVLQANFKASDTLACTNESITFTDLSNPGTAWLWNFGDGTTSFVQNPVHAYALPGVYTVSLVVTFAQGCSDTVVFPNYITTSSLQADFVSPTLSGCSPSQIGFNNLSSGASSYLWSFGDSTSSTVSTPSHIFSIPGYYTIKLIAYNTFGCADTMEKVDYIVIPGTYAQFSISGDSGCSTLNTIFTDQSINASSWSWNFGDGNISNLQNPTHVYNDSGSYIVTLITSDTLGCTSFYTLAAPITVLLTPDAQFTTNDTMGCQPYTVSFTNTTTGLCSYLWVFGDGDTSTLANPIHTYVTDGVYVPYLVATTNFGCQDTFFMSQGIRVLKLPNSSFSSNVPGGCSPANFSFNNQSSGLSSPVYLWNSGNGNTSSLQSPSFTYSTPGTYDVSLVVTNANGCRDSSSTQVTVFNSPIANGTTNNYEGCKPFNTVFNNLSVNANSCLWNFGDGGSDTVSNPAYTYLQSGLFNVSVIAYNSTGCSDTFNLPQPVKVNEIPVASFTADHTKGCLGDVFGLIDNSTNLVPGATYNWTIDGIFASNQQNPFITPGAPGLYDIALMVDNNNGCRDSITQVQFIQVFDSLPPPVSPLKAVTVTSDTTVKITWGVSTSQDFAAYVLSRFDQASNSFIPIFVDSNQNNGGIIVTSEYTDTGLNTLSNVYTYILETYDICGNVVSGNKLTPHSTIDVSASAATTNILVKWTAYVGCTVDSYEISRLELPSGIWQQIGSVPGNVTNYLDTGLTCPFNYAYRVNATNLCGDNFTSQSDTSAATPENKMTDQEVLIVRSTVVNNKSILTEWLPPVLYPDRVMMYNIYRSNDSITYSFLAAVPAISNSFIDNDVRVNKQNYFYRILAVNDCNLENTKYTNSSSILLRSNWQEEKTTLYWTKYRQWDTGVNQYVIEMLDENGQWKVIKVVDGTINAASIDQ